MCWRDLHPLEWQLASLHQIPIQSWHDTIGDPTYPDAILDRLVHNAYRIELRGDSMRRRKPDMPGDEKN